MRVASTIPWPRTKRGRLLERATVAGFIVGAAAMIIYMPRLFRSMSLGQVVTVTLLVLLLFGGLGQWLSYRRKPAYLLDGQRKRSWRVSSSYGPTRVRFRGPWLFVIGRDFGARLQARDFIRDSLRLVNGRHFRGKARGASDLTLTLSFERDDALIDEDFERWLAAGPCPTESVWPPVGRRFDWQVWAVAALFLPLVLVESVGAGYFLPMALVSASAYQSKRCRDKLRRAGWTFDDERGLPVPAKPVSP